MATSKKPYPERTRERIQAVKLLDKLQAHALHAEPMADSQITAARILLDRVMPVLKAVEHTGEAAIQKITVVIK